MDPILQSAAALTLGAGLSQATGWASIPQGVVIAAALLASDHFESQYLPTLMVKKFTLGCCVVALLGPSAGTPISIQYVAYFTLAQELSIHTFKVASFVVELAHAAYQTYRRFS